jgi:hypothetical protein
MKLFLQIVSMVTPVAIWTCSMMLQDKITLYHVDRVITGAEVIAFLIVGVMNMFAFVYLTGKEMANRKVCYSLAQWVVTLGMIVSFSYAWLTWQWMQKQPGGQIDIALDTMYGVINLVMVIYIVLVTQFIFASMFAKKILPFISIKSRKPLGEYLIAEGLIKPEDLERAVKRQQHDNLEQDNDDNEKE